MRGTSLTKHEQDVPASRLSATASNRPIYSSSASPHVRRCALIQRIQGANTPSLPRSPKRHVVKRNIAQRGSDVPPHRSHHLIPSSLHANGLSRDYTPTRDHLAPVLAATPRTQIPLLRRIVCIKRLQPRFQEFRRRHDMHILLLIALSLSWNEPGANTVLLLHPQAIPFLPHDLQGASCAPRN